MYYCGFSTIAASQKFVVKSGYLLPKPPGRPANPYNKFIKEFRAKVVQANPKLKNTEAFKKLSELYKDGNYEKVKKEQFKKSYEVETQDYEKQKDVYDSKFSIPKKPLAAYMIFL